MPSCLREILLPALSIRSIVRRRTLHHNIVRDHNLRYYSLIYNARLGVLVVLPTSMKRFLASQCRDFIVHHIVLVLVGAFRTNRLQLGVVARAGGVLGALASSPTVLRGGFAEPARRDVAEEEAHGGETAGDDDEVCFDETAVVDQLMFYPGG